MEFQTSLAPWQLALAALVPPGIFLLYFLKLKRKPLQVPSTFLWKKSIEDLRVNSLWQRLRKNILLLLQLLIAAAAILALLRPTSNAIEKQERLILIIDNSASMSALENGVSRLETAKRRAVDLVESMKVSQVGMVIASSDVARVAASYTSNLAELKRAVQSIEPSARRTDHTEAINVASGLANPQMTGDFGKTAEAAPAAVYLFSDGGFKPIESVALGNLDLRFIGVGQSTANVAVTSLSARSSEKQDQGIAVFGRIRNFGDKPVESTVELALDGKTIDVQKVKMEPKSEVPISFSLSSTDSGVLSVKVDANDPMPLDDQAWTALTPPRRVKVLQIGDDDSILDAVMKTKLMKRLCEVTRQPKSFADAEFEGTNRTAGFDFVIFDRCRPKSMPDCPVYMLGELPPSLSKLERTSVDFPGILNWNAAHPIMRFLSIDDVNIYKAFVVELPKGADVLIESDRGPVAFTMQRGAYGDLIQTFSILDDKGNWSTDWPLKLSFPLYMANIVKSLGSIETREQSEIRPGDPLTLKLDRREPIIVVYPSGKETSVKPAVVGRFELLDTERTGVYRFKAGEEEYAFAVNLFSDEESNIAPQDTVKVGAEEAGDRSRDVKSTREYWPILAAAALLILLLEWWLFNRRVQI